MDRKQTLLHYIVHVVELVYPNVLSFYEDLNVVEACQGESHVHMCAHHEFKQCYIIKPTIHVATLKQLGCLK